MTMGFSPAVGATTEELRVTAKTELADSVVALTLAHPEGKRLPDWTPGAHVDLTLPCGVTRQYSLCGNRWDAHTYRVGVLREAESRGGSAYIHDDVTEGTTVALGGPRNNFRLAPSPRYLFIAGGIGITPLLPMLHQADLVDADWQLLYGGRSRASMAFLDELKTYGDKVAVRPEDEQGLLDLPAWLPTPRQDTKVYCCGPGPLLDAVELHCADWPPGLLRTERFVARDHAPVRSGPFDVELSRSGLSLTVPRSNRCCRPSTTLVYTCSRPAARVCAERVKPPCSPASRITGTRSSTTTNALVATACSRACHARAPTASSSTSDIAPACSKETR